MVVESRDAHDLADVSLALQPHVQLEHRVEARRLGGNFGEGLRVQPFEQQLVVHVLDVTASQHHEVPEVQQRLGVGPRRGRLQSTVYDTPSQVVADRLDEPMSSVDQHRHVGVAAPGEDESLVREGEPARRVGPTHRRRSVQSRHRAGLP